MDRPQPPSPQRTDLFHLRALLFVPILRERFVASALKIRPPAVILDLEDAVPAQEKVSARAAVRPVAASFRAAGVPVLVRVNRGDGDDLDACRTASLDGVVLPKVQGPAETGNAAERLERDDAAPPRLVAMIETAAGVVAAPAIAAAAAVDALMFGAGDFVADAGFALDADALRGPATLVSLAARAQGKPAFGLADGGMGLIDDVQALSASAARARAIGYAGAPVIHPAQIAPVERAFAPSPQEVERARRVVAAFETSDGAAARLGSELIERPVYLRALSILRATAADREQTQTSGDR